MRAFTRWLVVVICAVSLFGCERQSDAPRAGANAPSASGEASDRPSDDASGAAASPSESTTSASGAADPEPTSVEEAWRQARAVARDPERALVPRINALEAFVEAHPGAAHRARRTTARNMMATLEARRKLMGALVSVRREVDTFNRKHAIRKIVEAGNLEEVLEIVLAEHARGRFQAGERFDPVELRGPAGTRVTVRAELPIGLNRLRHRTVRMVETFAPSIVGEMEHKHGSRRENAVLNDLLADELGGNIDSRRVTTRPR